VPQDIAVTQGLAPQMQRGPVMTANVLTRQSGCQCPLQHPGAQCLVAVMSVLVAAQVEVHVQTVGSAALRLAGLGGDKPLQKWL